MTRLSGLTRTLLFLFLLLGPGIGPGAGTPLAEEPASAVQTGDAAVSVPLTTRNPDPAQIEALLTTLKDPEARAAFLGNLETLLAASPDGGSGDGAGDEGRTEDGGAVSGIFITLSQVIERGVVRLTNAAVSLTDIGSLLPGLTALVQDPAELLPLGRQILIFAFIAAAGLLGARLVARLGRTPVTRLEDWMQQGTLLQSCLALVPLLALRAAGAGAFLAISQGIVTLIGIEATALLAGRVFAFAIAAHLLALAVLRTLLHPAGILSRVIGIAPSGCAYLVVWSNRIIATGIYGILGLQGTYILGMPLATYLFLDTLVHALIWLLLLVFILQNRGTVARYISEKTAGSPLPLFWSLLSAGWHLAAIALVTIRMVTQITSPGAVDFHLLEILGIVTATVIFWHAAWRLIEIAGMSVFSVSHELTDKYPSLEKRTNLYLPRLLGGAKILVSVLSIGALLHAWGIPVAEFVTSGTGRALVHTLVTVTLMTGAAFLAAEMIGLFVERRLHILDSEDRPGGRERTLLPLARNAMLVIIAVFTAFSVLSELGLDITPLLAGAGVVGLAIGFGAQSLVKDVISGVFLLIEDTLNVGDYVDVGGKSGTVEALSIRTLRLRDIAGDLHTIPFGSVDVITNMTRDFGYALADIRIAYREDADAMMQTLNEIGEELAADEKHGEAITGPFEMFGVQGLEDSSVIIRTRVQTQPGMQWAVRREFLRRVKRRFDTDGVEIPFPHRTLHFSSGQDAAREAAAFSRFTRSPSGPPSPGKTETAAPAQDTEYPETANPELHDAEAARMAEKDARDAEQRRRRQEQAEAAAETRQATDKTLN